MLHLICLKALKFVVVIFQFSMYNKMDIIFSNRGFIMKKIRAILLMLIGIVSLAFLASCSEKASVDIIKVTPMRTRIGVTLQIDDPDGLITADSVKAMIYDDDDEKLDTIRFDELDESEQTLTFDDLDEETDYKIVIKATVDDKSVTYYNKTVTTTNVGASEDNPIVISSTDEFLDIKYDDDAYYSLEADLDFADEAGEATSITPLFDSSTPFMGHFDGNGHTISNLQLETSSSYTYSGIFGYLGINSSVKDLNISNITLSSTKGTYLYLGALAGCNQGTVSNVHATNVAITHLGTGTSMQYIGGLLGVNCYIVEDSSVEGLTMTLRSRLQSVAGGFIGSNGGVTQNALNGAYVSNCFVTGADITTTFVTTHVVDKETASNADYIQYTGGFVGESMINISNSYADSKITGSATFSAGSVLDTYSVAVGGFAGRVIAASSVVNCVSNTTLSYTTADAYTFYAGALIGAAYDATVTNSVGILSGDNSVVNTADYSADEDSEVKEQFAKAFDGIAYSGSVLIDPLTSITNSGYVLASGATVDSATEGAMALASAEVAFDTTGLSEAVLAFYNAKLSA